MKHAFPIVALIIVLSALVSCETGNRQETLFSYTAILDRAYRYGSGEIIPVTIGGQLETDSSLSQNGRYLLYASNQEGGNYDIYLRDMKGVLSTRVTRHPARDRNPALSPDGKEFLYVSDRNDPEGDIFLCPIDTDELIKYERSLIRTYSDPEEDTENLTAVRNTKTGGFRSIRDATPVWSPDGKEIIFSSTRNGRENVWAMDSRGRNMVQLTEGGGRLPGISPEGKKIIFVREHVNNREDIHILDRDTGESHPILQGEAIETEPVFAGSSWEIIYTRIDRDTNGDGEIDYSDNSHLRYLDIRTGKTYDLTTASRSSFSPRWSPAFSSGNYRGVILYTRQRGDNLDIAVIPDTGVIPRKDSAREQYNLALNHFSYQDRELYLMALQRVDDFFGGTKDRKNNIFISRALLEGIRINLLYADRDAARTYLSRLNEQGKEDPYSRALYLYGRSLVSGKTDLVSIREAIGKLKKGNDPFYIPWLMEDLALALTEEGRRREALEVYNDMYRDYPDFQQREQIKGRIALLQNQTETISLTETMIQELKDGSPRTRGRLLRRFYEATENNRSDSVLEALSLIEEKSGGHPLLLSLAHHLRGKMFLDQRKFSRAEDELKLSLEKNKEKNYIRYRNHILLGNVYRALGDAFRAEKTYLKALEIYRTEWEDTAFEDTFLWCISHYEEYGERAEITGDYSRALGIYSRYRHLISLIHGRSGYEDLYAHHGPRAHVFYIDTYLTLKGENSIYRLEKKYRKGLSRARLTFDQAHIYGLAYLLARKATYLEKLNEVEEQGEPVGLVGMSMAFQDSLDQLEWSLFIDESFIEPYLLKSWIFQYIDLMRRPDNNRVNRVLERYFPERLVERNINMLEKALAQNNEGGNPEQEGNIHLTLANNYFILNNYPRARHHYTEARVYKKRFSHRLEEALFSFHYAYSLWQTGDNQKARIEFQRARNSYDAMESERKAGAYARQKMVLMKYFALLAREGGEYEEALSWYNRILELSARHRIPVDRIRYRQESAWALAKMGKTDEALDILKKTERRLRSRDNDPRDYRMRFYFFGLGPIPLINLGPDTAVIGDNRIVHPLNNRQKLLLNLSFQEEIYRSIGDRKEALRVLNIKRKYLKKQDDVLDQEAYVATLNRLGILSMKNEKYASAERYFQDAWKAARRSNSGSSRGMLLSIRNQADLYAFLTENRPDVLGDPANRIEKTIDRIVNFRESYEENLYREELKELTERRESAGREVSQEEKVQLRMEIIQQATRDLLRLDATMANLLYYYSELRFHGEPAARGSGFPAADKVISYHNTIYDGYKWALSIYNTILDEGSDLDPDLRVRLLLNASTCYQRTGDYQSAYTRLIDAVELSDRYLLVTPQLMSHHHMGRFLHQHGKDVEGADAARLARNHFEMTRVHFKTYSTLFADRPRRVERLYLDYRNFLLGNGQYSEALNLHFEYMQSIRRLLVTGTRPSFYDTTDARRFQELIRENQRLSSLEEELSSRLMEGKKVSEAKTADLLRNREKSAARIRDMISKWNSQGSRLGKLLAFDSSRKPPEGTVALILSYNNSPLIFFRKDGSFGLTDVPAEGLIPEDLASGDDLTIILTDDFLTLVKQGRTPPPGAIVLAGPETPTAINGGPPGQVQVFGSFLNLDEIETVRGYETDEASYRVFPCVMDLDDTPVLQASWFFSRPRLRPVLLLLRQGERTFHEELLLHSAASYAGVRKILVSWDMTPSSADEYLSYALTGALPPEGRFYQTSRGTFDDDQDASLAFKRYHDWLANGNIQEAMTSLNLWYQVTGEEGKRRYIFEGGRLLYLQGHVEEAEEEFSKIMEKGEDTSLQPSAAAWLIHLALVRGDLDDFSKRLEDYNVLIGETSVWKQYNSLSASLSSGRLPELHEGKEPGNFSHGRACLISAELLSLQGEEYAVLKKCLQDTDIILSEREKYVMNALQKGEDILPLNPETGSPPERYDIEDLDDVNEWESWRDRLAWYKKVMKETETGTPEAEQILESWIDNCDYLELSFLRKKLLLDRLYNQLAMENPRSARTYLNRGEGISSARHHLNRDYKLAAIEVDLALGDPDDAEEKIESLLFEPITPSLAFTLYLLRAESLLDRIQDEKDPAPESREDLNREIHQIHRKIDGEIHLLQSFDRMDILLRLHEGYISWLMNTGYHDQALYVLELLIQMQAIHDAGSDVAGKIKKIDGEDPFRSIKEDPSLLLSRLMSSLPLDTIQASLPENSVLISLTGADDSIFIWLMARDMKRWLIINETSEKLKTIREEYSQSLKNLSPSFSISRKLHDLLSPAAPDLARYKNILIHTGQNMSDIPIAIMGTESLLVEKHRIYYVPSLAALGTPYRRAIPRVAIYGEAAGMEAEVDLQALRSSGIQEVRENRDGRISFFPGSLYYKKSERALFTGKGIPYSASIGSSGAAYVPYVPEMLSPGSLGLVTASTGTPALIVTESFISGANRHLFTHRFHARLADGDSLNRAFLQALDSVRTSRRFTHPAYWEGIRLYIHSLDILSER